MVSKGRVTISFLLLFAVLSILFAVSLTLLLLGHRNYIPLSSYETNTLSFFSFVSLFAFFVVILLYYRQQKMLEEAEDASLHTSEHTQVSQEQINALQLSLERMKREMHHAFKHLFKLVLSDWCHRAVQQQKMPHAQVKKELFKHLKKEFTDVLFLEELLLDLKTELEDFKEEFPFFKENNSNSQ